MLGKKLTAMVILGFSFASARVQMNPELSNGINRIGSRNGEDDSKEGDNGNPFTFGNLRAT